MEETDKKLIEELKRENEKLHYMLKELKNENHEMSEKLQSFIDIKTKEDIIEQEIIRDAVEAVRKGDDEEVIRLLNTPLRKVDINKHDDENGITILISAILSNNYNLVKHIIEKYPTLDINQQGCIYYHSYFDENCKKSPLMVAVIMDSLEIVNVLLSDDRININDVDRNGDNALTLIGGVLINNVKYNRQEMIRLIISHPKFDINMPINRTYIIQNRFVNKTVYPINKAINYKVWDMVDFILTHPEYNKNTEYDENTSPLHYAFENSMPEKTFKLIMNTLMDNNNLKNARRINPLIYACDKEFLNFEWVNAS